MDGNKIVKYDLEDVGKSLKKNKKEVDRMDASEARRISNENGREEIIQAALKRVEEEIREAASKGRTRVCFASKPQYGGFFFLYKGKYEDVPELRDILIQKGYKFRDTGYVGGVYQHTEDICW